MDLRDGKITVGELLRNPRVHALAMREFPALRSPLAQRMVWNMTLNQLLELNGGRVPQARVAHLLRRLKEL